MGDFLSFSCIFQVLYNEHYISFLSSGAMLAQFQFRNKEVCKTEDKGKRKHIWTDS